MKVENFCCLGELLNKEGTVGLGRSNPNDRESSVSLLEPAIICCLEA